ncbi:MAG: hypothetical protein H7A37_07305 [Chlamydiales bacterium]|nr:hypothetical protein [Chlamydiia bacterium]MCP5508090.1 hypothetical protein [Chlamydiales bacterium]
MIKTLCQPTVWIAIIACFVAGFCTAAANHEELEEVLARGIDLDLQDPEYAEGVLSTYRGGIVTGSNFRMQADHIIYTKKEVDGQPIETIEAEGNLMLEFGRYVFVGQRIEYDVLTGAGIIFCGRSSAEPWYFGGKYIILNADGSISIHDGFLTTAQGSDRDWEVASPYSTILCNRYLTANHVRFNYFNVPLLWLPRFKIDLSTIFNAPVRYSIRWGGQQGPRGRMIYEIFSWERFQAYARLEYRIKRGFGGGIETNYAKPNCSEYCNTISYIASDNSISDPNERTRYRFYGVYHNLLQNGKTRIDARYDKLSDRDMATDYCDEYLKIETAGRTEFYIRHRETDWTANIYTHVRFNQFQTINQELPTLRGSLRPYQIGSTGIIGETVVKGSYLDFLYANNLCNVTDYNSPRYELRQQFFRPVNLHYMTVTPEAELIAIHYGNSPASDAENLVSGLFTLHANSKVHRFFRRSKHVVSPYAKYQYFTFPTSSPSDHYIFAIDDGWFRMNTLQFGIENSFYSLDPCQGYVRRYVDLEVYALAFFDTPTVLSSIPKLYTTATWYLLPTFKNCFDFAWDFDHDQVAHINVRSEWTVSQNLAVALEFRHRNAFDWRKAVHANFILDSYRSVAELRASQLSDMRDTLLLHTFYRFHPFWAFEFQLRSGWERVTEPPYHEYQADLHVNLQSSWQLKLSYQKKEDDHRVAFYFSMGAKCPNQCQPNYCCSPWPEF